VPLQEDDIIILSTDGLFDNVELADILQTTVQALQADTAKSGL
jgi:serine/threonine protein phosphatase PrpC